MFTKDVKGLFKGAQDLGQVREAINIFEESMQPEGSKLRLCYVQIFKSSLERPLMYLHNHFPQKWQERYETQSYHLVDPSWSHAKRSTIPFFWSDLENLTSEQEDMVQDAYDHGLRSGVLLPFHGQSGYSLLWVMSSEDEAQSRPDLESAKLLAYDMLPFIYESVKRIVFAGKSILSKREGEVLYWIAEGLNTEEVAQHLGISAATVEKHVASACKKLEARNRTQCVRIAIDLGLITPAEKSFNFQIKG